jgi:hypothetical protein
MKLKSEMDSSKTTICDECESEFYQASSKMISLFPECVNALYGYENCQHEFNEGRCLKCFRDGSTSTYFQKKK